MSVVTQVQHKIAEFIAYFTGFSTAAWGYASSNPLGFVGAAVAVATFFMTWYYKHKHLQLAERQAKNAASPEA